MDCIFCKIANGEIPSRKAYEDDTVLSLIHICCIILFCLRLNLTGGKFFASKTVLFQNMIFTNCTGHL